VGPARGEDSVAERDGSAGDEREPPRVAIVNIREAMPANGQAAAGGSK
jgi:hypothetical protein